MDQGRDDDPDELRLHQRMASATPREARMFLLLWIARPFGIAVGWLVRLVARVLRALWTAISLPVQMWRSRHDDW